jgi:hypothetical protein
MKGQRSKGLIGPIILRQAPRKHRSNSRDDGDSSDDDNAQSFADAIQQLAWTKDIGNDGFGLVFGVPGGFLTNL